MTTSAAKISVEEGSFARLPPELLVYIAVLSTPASLVRLEQLSKSCRELLRDADAICWRHHVLSQVRPTTLSSSSINPMDGVGEVPSIPSFTARMKGMCINKVYWDDLHTWKAIYRRVRKLRANWSTHAKAAPKTEVDIVGFNRVNPLQFALPTPKLRSMTSPRVLDVPYATQDSSYVWRARLDTSRDANFILMTWHTGGLRVVDATPKYGNGRILWELPNWSVRPYAHLEMSGGIACWDGEDGIEVWKRWKMVLGQEGEDEPPNKRGQFVKVATLPELDNTRGFMLNDLQHLTVCSSSGRSVTYDLRPKEPVLLHQYAIPTGAAGHLEHDDTIAIYSMGQKGYAIYEKESGQSLGTLDFSDQASTLFHVMQESKETNFFCVDPEQRYAELASNEKHQSNPRTHHDTKIGPPRKLFVTVPLEKAGLADRTMGGQMEIIEIQPFVRRSSTSETPTTHRQNAIDLNQDLWGAAMIRKLQDGSTILVARSRGGRVMVCTDLLGLLAALRSSSASTEEAASIKIRQCLSIIECGGRASRTEFYTGGWLAVHNGRAAWEIDDQVYMLELPTRRNALAKAGTPIWMLPSLYNDEIPLPSLQMPISFMSLHDDAFLSTYLHPSYILISNQGYTRWETTILKSVRLIYFSTSSALMEDTIQDGKKNDEEEDNIHPLTNANKALHRRWLLTGRRLAQAAEEDREEWTDEEGDDEEAGAGAEEEERG